jgi:FkbM family methyltransferase
MTVTYKSQSGEDRLLEGLFRHKKTGFYVEVGAFDGIEMSNSVRFEELGWQGILVEADPELAEECRRNRPKAIVENCAAVSPAQRGSMTFEVVKNNRGLSSLGLNSADLDRVRAWTGGEEVERIAVAARTMDEILESHDVGEIDFVTIDVEGYEWDVLQGFKLSRWRPQVIILERNRTLPDSRIMRRLHSEGYRYTRTTGVNDWFQRGDGGKPGPAYHMWLGLTYYFPKFAAGARHRVSRLLKRRPRRRSS